MSRKFIIPTKENKIAILCSNEEETLELYEALGEKYPTEDNSPDFLDGPIGVYFDTSLNECDWHYISILSQRPEFQIIPFNDAIIPNNSYLAEILGVEDEQEFIWRNQLCRVVPCVGAFSIQIKRDTGWSYICTQDFESIIQYHNEIKFPIDFGIIGFIKQFQCEKELFANGMCYWFAHILYNRFENSSIEYHPIDNHFSCRIMNVNYDITGVIDGSEYVNWNEYKEFDPTHAERIEKYCIRKED